MDEIFSRWLAYSALGLVFALTILMIGTVGCSNDNDAEIKDVEKNPIVSQTATPISFPTRTPLPTLTPSPTPTPTPVPTPTPEKPVITAICHYNREGEGYIPISEELCIERYQNGYPRNSWDVEIMGSGIPYRFLGYYEYFKVNDEVYRRGIPSSVFNRLSPGEHTFAIAATGPYEHSAKDKIWSDPITFTVIPSDNPSVNADPVLLAICHVNPEEQKPIPDELCIERYQKGFIAHNPYDIEKVTTQSRIADLEGGWRFWQVVGENLSMYQSYVIDGRFTGGARGEPLAPVFYELSPGEHTISVALPKESNEITFTILSD